jgi:1,4-alpha-glucan branching enzyme
MPRKTSGAKKRSGAKRMSSAKKRVKFAIEAKDASAVYVAGTFNGWDAGKNRLRMKDGIFSTTLLVSQGRHEYKFIVDDVWLLDPECQEWTPNDKGSLNSVRTVD